MCYGDNPNTKPKLNNKHFMETYQETYAKQVAEVISHLTPQQQGEITEKAVILLGDKLTDKTYLETLKQLVK